MRFRHLLPVTVGAAAIFSGLSSLKAQYPPESQIYWTQSANQAASLARQSEMPILMYVTSDNCGYCRKMEQEVWSNPQIISMVEEGFVPLKLHAERDAQLVAGLKIRGFPTTFVFTRDARPVQRATGYQRPTQMAAMLRSATADQAGSLAGDSVDDRSQVGIPWQNSVAAARTLASQSKRPILAFVTSNDCVHCRKMEEEVWSDASIIRMVEDGFVPLELNAERDTEVVAALGVPGFPTTIVFSPDAKYVTSRAGYIPLNQLAELLHGGQQALLVSQKVTQNRAVP